MDRSLLFSEHVRRICKQAGKLGSFGALVSMGCNSQTASYRVKRGKFVWKTVDPGMNQMK